MPGEILDWPIGVLRPRHVAIWPHFMTRPEQVATNGLRRSNGLTQVQWRLRLIDVPVHGLDLFRTLMATLGEMEGDRTLVRIRLPDRFAMSGRFSLATEATRAQYPHGVPFSDGALFSDGVGFAVTDRVESLAASAVAGSREVTISAEGGVPAGVLISIAEFVYVTTRSWDEGADTSRVRISPVLRMAAEAGDPVDLAPVFIGTCISEAPGSEEREEGRRGLYNFDFVEDLTRLVVFDEGDE